MTDSWISLLSGEVTGLVVPLRGLWPLDPLNGVAGAVRGVPGGAAMFGATGSADGRVLVCDGDAAYARGRTRAEIQCERGALPALLAGAVEAFSGVLTILVVEDQRCVKAVAELTSEHVATTLFASSQPRILQQLRRRLGAQPAVTALLLGMRGLWQEATELTADEVFPNPLLKAADPTCVILTKALTRIEGMIDRCAGRPVIVGPIEQHEGFDQEIMQLAGDERIAACVTHHIRSARLARDSVTG